MMWGSPWVGRLGSHTSCNYMLPVGSTLGGCAKINYEVASGLTTLGGGVGDLWCCGTSVIGGGSWGGAAMLKKSNICFKAGVCLSPSVVGGIVGFGLRS